MRPGASVSNCLPGSSYDIRTTAVQRFPIPPAETVRAQREVEPGDFAQMFHSIAQPLVRHPLGFGDLVAILTAPESAKQRPIHLRFLDRHLLLVQTGKDLQLEKVFGSSEPFEGSIGKTQTKYRIQRWHTRLWHPLSSWVFRNAVR